MYNTYIILLDDLQNFPSKTMREQFRNCHRALVVEDSFCDFGIFSSKNMHISSLVIEIANNFFYETRTHLRI